MCLISLILLLMPLPVLAEGEETAPPLEVPVEMDFNGSSDLAGTEIILEDQTGNQLGSTTIDPTGQGVLSYNGLVSPVKIKIVEGDIKEVVAEETVEITADQLLLSVFITFLVTALLFYVIGRISCYRVLQKLREVVNDKDLD